MIDARVITFIRSRYFIFFIIGLFTFHVAYLSIQSCSQREWCGQDIDQYKDYSDSLLAGKGFAASKVANMYYIDPQPGVLYVPEILRLPAYSVVISVARLIYDHPRVILLLNFMFYSGLLFYTFLLARKLLTTGVAYVTMILIAMHPTVLVYTALLPSVDIFAAFSLVAFIYHALELSRAPSRMRNTMLTSLFAVLAIFLRQNTIVLVFGLFVALLLHRVVRSKGVRSLMHTSARPLLIAISITLFCIIGWSIRNYHVAHRFGLTFYSGNQLYTEHVYFTKFPNPQSTELYKMGIEQQGFRNRILKSIQEGKSVQQTYAEFDVYVKQLTLRHILENKSKTWSQLVYAVKSFYLVSPFYPGKKGFLHNLTVLYDPINLLLLVSFFATPFFVIRRKLNTERLMIVCIWALSLLFTVGSAFYHGGVVLNRGMVPVISLVTLLVTYDFSLIFAPLFHRIRDDYVAAQQIADARKNVS